MFHHAGAEEQRQETPANTCAFALFGAELEAALEGTDLLLRKLRILRG